MHGWGERNNVSTKTRGGCTTTSFFFFWTCLLLFFFLAGFLYAHVFRYLILYGSLQLFLAMGAIRFGYFPVAFHRASRCSWRNYGPSRFTLENRAWWAWVYAAGDLFSDNVASAHAVLLDCMISPELSLKYTRIYLGNLKKLWSGSKILKIWSLEMRPKRTHF